MFDSVARRRTTAQPRLQTVTGNDRAGAGNTHIPLVGASPAFRGLLDLAARIAGWGAPVLLEGETGTGKELIARAIHYGGPRSAMSFVPVNCGALPDALVENELFGHQRGAYTGATESYVGMVAQAHGGTLFLDEVDALTPKAQVSLLRFMQDTHFRPLGSLREDHSDVRVIAASNADLDQLARQGQFRSDLLFRLKVLNVKVPPLRERGEDVVLLARHFLHRFSLQYDKPVMALDPEFCAWMRDYTWPGNVRELENLIHREFLLGEGTQLSFAGHGAASRQGPGIELGGQTMASAKAKAVVAFERAYLTALMAEAKGNVSLAARIAGKERRSLGRLLKKHGFGGRV